MKKILILFLIFLIPCAAEADLSDGQDIYVRRDVYQSDMRNINEKLDTILSELKAQREDINKLTQAVAVLSERIDGVNKSLNEKIDGVEQKLGNKIDAVEQKLNEKIDAVDKRLSVRMDDLRNGLYLVIALFATIMLLPFVKNWYEERIKQKVEAFKPSFTLDDVKKLIEENNAMLLSRLQGGAI